MNLLFVIAFFAFVAVQTSFAGVIPDEAKKDAPESAALSLANGVATDAPKKTLIFHESAKSGAAPVAQDEERVQKSQVSEKINAASQDGGVVPSASSKGSASAAERSSSDASPSPASNLSESSSSPGSSKLSEPSAPSALSPSPSASSASDAAPASSAPSKPGSAAQASSGDVASSAPVSAASQSKQ